MLPASRSPGGTLLGLAGLVIVGYMLLDLLAALVPWLFALAMLYGIVLIFNRARRW